MIVREKGVMLAPVKVLHLRDPEELAIECLGEERAREPWRSAQKRRSVR